MNNRALTPFRLQKFLAGLRYPTLKQIALEHASQRGADEEVLATLRSLPERTYDSPIALSRACATR